MPKIKTEKKLLCGVRLRPAHHKIIESEARNRETTVSELLRTIVEQAIKDREVGKS